MSVGNPFSSGFSAGFGELVTDLTKIMDALAAAVPTGATRNVFAYPPDSLVPPGVVVGYPTAIEFDAVFGNASDKLTIPVWFIGGKADSEVERDVLADIISGASELKDAFEGTIAGTSTIRVTRAEREYIALGGVDYIAMKFELEVYT